MGALDGGCLDAIFETEKEVISLNNEFEDEKILAIEDAVTVLLHGLGEDASREGLKKTPYRVAKAFQEATRGYKERVEDIIEGALFTEPKSNNPQKHSRGIVIVQDLDLFSCCELCLLPFAVKCHIGYVPGQQKIIGLSKLSRVADVFAKRLQDPRRLADEVCLSLYNGIKPAGLVVLLHCSHIVFPDFDSCSSYTGHETSANVLALSKSGVFKTDADLVAEFLSLLNISDRDVAVPSDGSWCPTANAYKDSCWTDTNPKMISSVFSILNCSGEDVSRKGLSGTPARYVNWLMSFRSRKPDMKRYNFLHELQTRNGYESILQCEMSIPFWSQCEHHLLPFSGSVHIGYLHSAQVGRSVLQSVVNFRGFSLQVQERLTTQVADDVSGMVGEHVMVVVRASHMCMISRGIERSRSSATTTASRGRFTTDSSLSARFIRAIPLPGVPGG